MRTLPVRGDEFDRWLGSRTLVLLGDSLSAQQFYSLVWLLGDAVVSLADVRGAAPEEQQQQQQQRGKGKGARVGSGSGAGNSVPSVESKRLPSCASSVGDEGGWLSEATLRSGGRLVKVLRHSTFFDELRRVESAWWRPWLASADIVVLNLGHHYHAVDKAFRDYGRLAHVAMQGLERCMRPQAQLVFRTTNVGHPACENATRPLRSRREAWAQLTEGADLWAWKAPKKGVDMFKDKYSWRGPPIFEHEWRPPRRAPARSGALRLPQRLLPRRARRWPRATAMRYSAQRGSASSARLLHYCYPGPTDFWALSLYNLLLNNAR